MLKTRAWVLGSVGLLAVAACGDDDGMVTFDARPDSAPAIDGAPDAVPPITIFSDEGGQVIFEFINPSDDVAGALGLNSGDTIFRTMAYFINDMDPDANMLPAPGSCLNLLDTDGWPLGQGTNQVYLDVGTMTVTGKNTADADVTLDIPKNAGAGTDAIGRDHEIFYQRISPPDAAAFLKPNSMYDLALGGSTDFAATTYEDSLLIPSAFTVSNPGLNDTVLLVPGVDMTVHWSTPTTDNLPAGVMVGAAVILADPATNNPVIFCPTNAADGMFTIPGAMITSYVTSVEAAGNDASAAILLRQHVVHQPLLLRNDEPANRRRVDMLPVYCFVQLVGVDLP